MTKENDNNNNQTYILHSDGNYFTRAKKAGFGGYITDNEGTTLVEYTEQIKDLKYHFCYEILGLIRGLEIARSMHIKNIVAYGDDKTLMENVSTLSKILKNKSISPSELDCLPNNSKIELYIQVLELIKNFDTFDCHYIPREENKYSDSLSRRYANLIEKNYINLFYDDLRRSEQNLEIGIRPKRRQFFSAPTVIKMQEKNNPFLVAPSRNKPLRAMSRSEFKKNYQFVFMEVGTNEQTKTLKMFYYKDKNSLENPVIISSKTFPKEDFSLSDYLDMLNNNYHKIDSNRPLWLHSNVTEYNAMFEQKEKIPRDDFIFSQFVDVYNNFSKTPRVFCHHFPFKHKFSNEIIQKKNRELEAKQSEIQSMEELFAIFSDTKLSIKERKKSFGLMFRYHIKENEEILGRELTDVEKRTYRDTFEQEVKNYMAIKLEDLKKEQKSSYQHEENSTENSTRVKLKI